MSNIFTSEQYCGGKRPIEVRVDRSFITFHFAEEEGREFYDIPTDEWISDANKPANQGRRWRQHMAEKAWVTDEMMEYIENEVDKISNK